MSSGSDARVALPWFRAETYARIRASMDDAATLPADHADWLAQALSLEQTFIAQGVTPVRVPIEQAPFIAWCAERLLFLDAMSRQKYANAHAAFPAQDRSA